MLKNLTLVLGGSKSGKSAFAVSLAKQAGDEVTFVATASPGDEEMAERIAKHREARPSGWTTVEANTDIAGAIKMMQQRGGSILIDCWSFYVANLLDGFDSENSEPDIIDVSLLKKVEQQVINETRALIEEARKWEKQVIIVSNEVGLGLVPPYPLGRCFRDLIGISHQILAREAAKVYLVVAGLPVAIKE